MPSLGEKHGYMLIALMRNEPKRAFPELGSSRSDGASESVFLTL